MHSSFQRLVVIAIAAFTVLMANNLAATVWCVNLDGSGGCDTLINAAIAKASAGDTVFVWDGIYRENVGINKGIILMGAGTWTTRVVPQTGNGIALQAGFNGASIKNIAITAPLGDGIRGVAASGSLHIVNCEISHCSGSGINLWQAAINRTAYISNCVIYGNGDVGIQVWDGELYLINSVVAENNSWGVNFLSPELQVYDYVCLYGNQAQTLPGGGVIIYTDPQFVDPVAGNYHLQPGSPCIDAGRPGSAYEDCDGTRNDMGVYGGPNAVCGPGPSVTELQIVPATVVKGQSFKVQAKAKTK